MLANNFKTPAELNISSAQFDALFKVLGMLEREEIPAGMFTMAQIGDPACGTPGCILGWALSLGITRFAHISDKPELERLFFPGLKDTLRFVCPYTATQAQAASALRSYLTTGEPRWQEAMV